MVVNRTAPVAFDGFSAPAVTLLSLLMINVFILLLLPLFVVSDLIYSGDARTETGNCLKRRKSAKALLPKTAKLIKPKVHLRKGDGIHRIDTARPIGADFFANPFSRRTLRCWDTPACEMPNSFRSGCR